MLSSYSVQSRYPSPHFPPLCAPIVSGFSSLPSPSNSKLSTLNFLRGLCSGGSLDPRFSPIPHLSSSSLSRTPTAVGCELSTVSRFTPSTNADPVDAASSISPLFASLTENTGGGGGTSFQPRNLHCHPRHLSVPPYFITSLPCPHFRFTHQHPQLQSFHTLTSQFSVYRTFFNFPPPPTPHLHCALPLPIRKQAPAPAVIQPSGPVCPGGA